LFYSRMHERVIMFQGRYEIILKGAKKPEIESDIVFDDPPSKIVISKDGAVEILADSEERSYALSLVVRIAIESVTRWIGTELRPVSEKNLATGEVVARGLYGDAKVSIPRIDESECREAVRRLLKTGPRSLIFLVHATQISGANEVSALVALTALEIELGQIVKDETLQSLQKIAVLEYTKSLPTEEIGKLKTLNSLRNKLAHGEWSGVRFEAALGNALGGSPSQWVTHGHMTMVARDQVTEKVIKMLSVLSRVKR